MTTTIVVPARYASTRYPGKPLVDLRGAGGDAKPLILRSWEAAIAVRGVAQVVVATDDDRIAQTARGFGARVAMTPASARNGTERCAAALDALGDADLIVNLQGDAPLTPPSFVEALIERMVADPSIQVATPAVRATAEIHRRLLADQQAGQVGGTTVAIGTKGDGLYFSKSVIPHISSDRLGDPALPVFLHIGVYAYRRAALESFVKLAPSTLELREKLEQLRALEAGMRIDAAIVESVPLGVDTPHDLETARRLLANS